MKLKLKAKSAKPPVEDNDEDVPSFLKKGKSASKSSSAAPSWLITNRQAQHEAMEQSRMMSAFRPPEVWLKDGESRTLRFRDSDPIGCFFTYSIRVDGKFRQFTVPPEDSVDLFKENVRDLRQNFRALYEVIDKEGYFSKKKNKQIRNVPRFFLANGKVHKLLETLREKRGSLTDFDIEITRVGEGTQTQYQLIPQDREPLDSRVAQQPRIAGEAEKFYRPLSEAEQRVILRSVARHSVEDED